VGFVGAASAQEQINVQEEDISTDDSGHGEFTTQAKKSLRAFWQMEDRARLVDSSRYRNNGNTHHIKGVADGFRGKAYHFNGSNSIAKVPSSHSLNSGSADLRLTLHLKFTQPPSTAVGDYDLIRKGLSTSVGGDYKAEILQSGRAFCLFKDSSETVGKIVNGPNLADGRWPTLSCTKTSTSVQLTVDGTTYTKHVHLGSIANGSPLTVGAQAGGADWFAGNMDEVSVRIF
jgi:Concanavalin A-like lectin/glucanases superfamily